MRRLLLALLLLYPILLILNQPVMAHLPDTVSVNLFEAYAPPKQVFIQGPFILLAPVKQRLPRGNYQLVASKHRLVLSRVGQSSDVTGIQGQRFLIEGVDTEGVGISLTATRPRFYAGSVVITLKANQQVALRNQVNAQDYVSSVVGSETLPMWPVEALKAQAVLTQTRLSRYKTGDILGDSTQQEAYLGLGYTRPEIRQAVRQVWGETLTYQNQPIVPYYHAACGGRTSDGALFSGEKTKSPAYLSSVPCAFCKQSNFCQTHTARIPRKVFEKAFGPGIPSIKDRDSAQRPMHIRLGNGKVMSGYAFWLRLGKQLGWDKAPGTRYTLSAGKDNTVVIRSNGAGHGIGLCQWGAAEQARAGHSYSEILQYYFPKATLISQ